MSNLPEDQMELGKEGGGKLKVDARKAQHECRTQDQGSQSFGKGPFTLETSVCHDKFHLRLVGSPR